MRLFFASEVQTPGVPTQALTPHCSFRKARAAARRASKEAPALVLERDYNTGLSTLFERWENDVCVTKRWAFINGVRWATRCEPQDILRSPQ